MVLQGAAATRKAILVAFKAHLIKIKVDDAITFHFSCHGSTQEIPPGWLKANDKENQLEVILPYDVCGESDDNLPVCACLSLAQASIPEDLLLAAVSPHTFQMPCLRCRVSSSRLGPKVPSDGRLSKPTLCLIFRRFNFSSVFINHRGMGVSRLLLSHVRTLKSPRLSNNLTAMSKTDMSGISFPTSVLNMLAYVPSDISLTVLCIPISLKEQGLIRS